MSKRIKSTTSNKRRSKSNNLSDTSQEAQEIQAKKQETDKRSEVSNKNQKQWH